MPLHTRQRASNQPHVHRLPWSALLALSTAVFITSLTETLPAGVLPSIAGSLDTTPALVGQSVTVYAAGTALTAIPLARATGRISRKRVLLAAMTLFLAANTLTAAAPDLAILLAARTLAGIAAGLAWALLAGYAARIAPKGLEGRSIAVAMTGIPLALSLGVPVGTFLSDHSTWRTVFAAISIVTVVVLGWITLSVPAIIGTPSTTATQDITTRGVFAVPGIPAVMAVVLLYVLGHTVVYAYIAPYLQAAQPGISVDAVLLVFGIACLISIWYTGRHIDNRLRSLARNSAILFVAATTAFTASPAIAVIWIAAAAWGLGWGGIPTLLQTAAVQVGARHSTTAADTAQAILVTLWNTAMALGGILGGVLLDKTGNTSLPAAAALLGAASLVTIWLARSAFR